MKKKAGILFIFVAVYLVLVKLAGMGYNTYVEGDFHSTLHADAAGYNVYLTALTPYDYKEKFADHQDERCGFGFTLDENKKVITKYNYGVALLQSPFYGLGKVYANKTHKEFTGYNPYCQRLVDLAGIFYGLAGLFILFFFMRNYFSGWISFFAVLIMFLSFNILWYVIVQPGMSHVYSFFLFSLFLFLGKKYLDTRRTIVFVALCFAASLIILIRPLNGIVLSILFFLPGSEYKSAKDRLLAYCTLKNILIAAFILVIVFIPQVIYWKFAYNEYFPDTYPNEKFTNLAHPRIKSLLFAAKSGLLIYNPIYFLLLPIMAYMAIRAKETYYKAALGILLALIYLSASWYEYFFGCGLGNRNFAEYSVLLLFPIGYMLHWLSTRKPLLILASLVIILCCGINMKLTESFDMCFFGKDTWDYKEFKYLVLNKPNYREIDYEKDTTYLVNTTVVKDPWNPNNSCSKIDPGNEYASTVLIPVSELGYVVPRKLEFSVEINPVKENFRSDIAVQVLRDGKQVFFQGMPYRTIDPVFQKFEFYCPLPTDLQKTDKIQVFFWNRGHFAFYTDNYKLKFR